MSILKIFESFNLDNRSKEEVDTFMSRKDALRKMSKWGRTAAMASLPLGVLSAMPKVAFAKKADALSVLNYALTLEYLEFHFYNHALLGDDVALNFTPEELAAITLIRDHELAHVNLLTDVIENTLMQDAINDPGYAAFNFRARPLGPDGNPVDLPTGIFEQVYSDKAVFLAVAQAFEDTGVRAYKGQATELMDNDALLTAALRIHSVEARHAAHIRRMRILNGTAAPGEKAWITTPDYDGLGSPLQMEATAPVYQNEQNTTHGGINVVTVTQVPVLAVEEGWDEPLSMEEVVNIIQPFAPFV